MKKRWIVWGFFGMGAGFIFMGCPGANSPSSPNPSPTPTVSVSGPTATATLSSIVSMTATPSATATTTSGSPSFTPTPSATTSLTTTPTPTATGSPTATLSASATGTLSPSPTFSYTLTYTATPSATFTSTASTTPTATSSATSTHSPVPTIAPPAYVRQWGSPGNGNGMFDNPQFIAISPGSFEFLYVTDNQPDFSSNALVQIFAPNGTFSTQWTFASPTVFEGIQVDSSNIYVVDKGNSVILKLNGSGSAVTQWGGPGSGNGQLSLPQGLALDGSGNLFVADTGNNRIQEFTTNGAYVAQFGNGSLSYPQGLVVSGGSLYETDGANRVNVFTQAYDPIKHTFYWTLSGQWGSAGSGNGQFSSPFGIAAGPTGNIYVADTGNNRIQEFDASGNYLTQWGGYGYGNGMFYYPDGIAVDSSGNVFVVDNFNYRIQEFH